MPEELLIRDYAPGDLPACRALWAELTQWHRDLYDDQTIGGPDPGGYFDTYLATPGLRGPWVAELGGRVVGLTGLLPHWGECEIEPVVVSSGLRAQGIGTALVAHAVAQARAAGHTSVTVRPVARNAAAISFFVRQGFDMLGQIELSRDLREERPTRNGPHLTLHSLRLDY